MRAGRGLSALCREPGNGLARPHDQIVSPLARRPARKVWVGVTLLLAFAATDAFAHASDRGHVLLLPTGHYLFGGACAVAASFLAMVALPHDLTRRLAAGAIPLPTLPEAARMWTSLGAFLVLAVLVAAGLFGSRDPLSNPLPLTIWTLMWVGLTLIQGLVGDLWRWINPWYAPVRLARHVLPAPRTLPGATGCWPAVLLFAAFAWFELIDIAPDDPARLAVAVGGYWLATFVAMLVFGFDGWSRGCEFLTLFFGFVSRLAPIGRDDAGHATLRPPGAGLAKAEPLPSSAVMFLLLALASVSFDGFSRTFLWLDLIGVNPLEFPGRTAVRAANTAGLALAFGVLCGLFLLCVAAGRWLAGEGSLMRSAGLLVWSLVPIALAFHFAHYLAALLVNGQYAIVAASDPFSLGWNLFGTAHMPVGAGIVMGSGTAWLLWNLQAGAIILGHVLAVVVAHMLAGRLHPEPRRAAFAELPLTALMVGYTVFGLWLLSTPTGA